MDFQELTWAAPVVNPKGFRVEWRGRVCLLGNTDAYRFIELLVSANGMPVSFIEIGEQVMCDPLTPSVNIRSLKRRLVARLRACGMGELADAIHGSKEHYWLVLPTETNGVVPDK